VKPWTRCANDNKVVYQRYKRSEQQCGWRAECERPLTGGRKKSPDVQIDRIFLAKRSNRVRVSRVKVGVSSGIFRRWHWAMLPSPKTKIGAYMSSQIAPNRVMIVYTDSFSCPEFVIPNAS